MVALSVTVGVLTLAATSTPVLGSTVAEAPSQEPTSASDPRVANAERLADAAIASVGGTAAALPPGLVEPISQEEIDRVVEALETFIDLYDGILTDEQLFTLNLLANALPNIVGCLLNQAAEEVILTFLFAALSIGIIFVGGPVGAVLAIALAVVRIAELALGLVEAAGCLLLPAAPSDLEFVGPDCAEAAFVLRFTDRAVNETGFIVEDAETGLTQTYPSNPATGPVTVSFTRFDSLEGSQHEFTVRAFNDIGTSAPSNAVEASADCSSGQPPAAPTIELVFYACAGANSSVLVAFQDNSFDETGFQLTELTTTGFTQGYPASPETGDAAITAVDPRFGSRSFMILSLIAVRGAAKSLPSTVVVPCGVTDLRPVG